MRLKIILSSDRLKLPIHYNELVQGFIYNHISKELAQWLHDEGFAYEKRNFKLFTFSRITGKFNIDSRRGTIEFMSPSKLTVSSPIERFTQELANEMVKSNNLRLGKNRVYLKQLDVESPLDFSYEMKIKMLSPVTIYSTLQKADGSSKTYYYSPFESEFSLLLEANLKKKASILLENDKVDEYSFSIEPTRVKNRDQKILTYKNFVIKAWMGEYKIKGSPKLHRIAYDSGLGGKNSQGFGCFEVID